MRGHVRGRRVASTLTERNEYFTRDIPAHRVQCKVYAIVLARRTRTERERAERATGSAR